MALKTIQNKKMKMSSLAWSNFISSTRPIFDYNRNDNNWIGCVLAHVPVCSAIESSRIDFMHRIVPSKCFGNVFFFIIIFAYLGEKFSW